MIKSFRHKGLKQFFETGSKKGIQPALSKNIGRKLDAINAATTVQDLKLPGFGLHELKGDRKGTWSILVSGNYRITFSFQDQDAFEVDLEDYH